MAIDRARLINRTDHYKLADSSIYFTIHTTSKDNVSHFHATSSKIAPLKAYHATMFAPSEIRPSIHPIGLTRGYETCYTTRLVPSSSPNDCPVSVVTYRQASNSQCITLHISTTRTQHSFPWLLQFRSLLELNEKKTPSRFIYSSVKNVIITNIFVIFVMFRATSPPPRLS
jgi:hypothetical protein